MLASLQLEHAPGILPKMTIHAFFFDAAGTLMRPRRGVGESYASFAAKYGVEVSREEVSARFRTCFDDAPRLAFPGEPQERITELEREWWKALVARVFAPWSPFDGFDEFFSELFAYFAQPQAWSLYPEVPETLAALKKRGLILSVISNFDSRLLHILEGLGVASCFVEIFVSSRIGYAKPDSQIFQAALRHHRLRADQVAHVGDSEINDRLGARNAGLRAILIDRNRRPDGRKSEHIATLRSLLEWVE